MADNVDVTPGSGATIAADLIAGALYVRNKLIHGADGVNDGDVSDANPLPVDDAGGSLTVDGTVAATQSGTWTVQPGNTANTTAWKVDGSAVTQPVSASSLPLPSGASTAAKQPALGTAGTASADVITIQGIASMTAVKVDGSAVTQPVSGTITATIAAGATTIAKAEDAASADADVGVPAMAVRKATPANTSGLDGDYEMLQMSAGRLWASATIDAALPTGTNTLGSVKVTDGTLTASVRDTGSSDSLNVAIVDASGNQVTSFGGGTQYTEADTDATITGTAILWEDTSDTLRAVSAAKPLPIGDAGGSLTVDNGGTFAVQATVAAGATNIAKAEDDASANADVGVPAMAVRKATPANVSGTDGDYEFLQMSAGRLHASSVITDGTTTVGVTLTNELKVSVNNGSLSSAVNIQDGGNSITVDNGGTFAVQATCTNAGTFAVQQADRNGVIIRPTITISASPDYAANDVIDTTKTLSNVMSASGRQALLKTVTIKDDAGQAPALSLLFFRAAPSGGTYTDNSALVWGTNDLGNLVGCVRITGSDWYTLVNNSIVSIGNIDQLMGSASSDLSMLIIADGAYNAAATTDLSMELCFEQR